MATSATLAQYEQNRITEYTAGAAQYATIVAGATAFRGTGLATRPWLYQLTSVASSVTHHCFLNSVLRLSEHDRRNGCHPEDSVS